MVDFSDQHHTSANLEQRIAQLEQDLDTLRTQPAREIEFLHVVPDKLREGMIVGADGTDWDPGSGQGVYCYFGGAWNKL